ncbi:MAG: phosphoribosylanthranilate isomerase [Prevotella sp.]|nr:phosphoribosylanthranilate isomerase [Prevotella sp.]
MLIKVCGMREPENVREVSSLDIDLMGFIFYPKSSRYVQQISMHAGIIPDRADDEIIDKKRCRYVGVFVDDMPQNIVTRVYNYHLDYVQLHGNESPVMIENLKRTLIPDIVPDIKIIKALSIREADDVKRWREYEGYVDMFLFDTQCKGYGGSGEQFDWSILDAYDGNIPFLLSGGIGPDDAERVKAFHHPKCVGIDLNSRFEISPALKDVEKLRGFIKAIDEK